MSVIDLPNKQFYDAIEQYKKWQEATENWVMKNMGIPKKYLENNYES